MTYTPTEWAVTRIAHPALRDVCGNCRVCLDLADEAITMALLTGAVGATVELVIGATVEHVNGDDRHSCTVARAIDVITR